MRNAVAYLGIVLLVACASRADDGLTLTRDGRTDYAIVLPNEPTPVERTAARELREHLAEATGAVLPVVGEGESPGGKPRIVVGHGALTRRLLPELRPGELSPDAIVIKTVGRDLVLAGHPRRGTLYAVYTFLEDTVGVRWWTSEETYVPRRPTLTVPAIDVVYAPKLADRATRYLDLSDGCFTDHSLVTEDEQRAMGVFATRMRLNGHDHYSIPDEYGGPNGLIGWVHTFYQINGLLPVAEYFDEHPAWYSLIDGRRRRERSQLCLTNEAMRREMVRVVKERIRANPGATMISVSQNDWHGYCECDACKAIDEREESHAGTLIHFVNAVAAEVEKEFPDVLIETLAYQYTRKPPKHVRPRHNVVIRLCSIECSFVETLAEGRDEANRSFRRDLEGWARISPQLYIWDYVTNFRGYLLPHPNFHVLAPNLRYFVANGAMGVFEQGDSGCRVGDFVRLRAWYLAHLLWDPDADEKALLDEFMNGYYGPAAPHLIAYLDLMSEAGRRAGVPIRCFTDDTRAWLTLADLNRASEQFDRAAQAVAGDPVLAERVRRERLPLDHVWLRRYDRLRAEARRTGVAFRGPADPHAALAEFRELLRKHRAGEYRQGRLVPDDYGDEFSFVLRERIPPGDTPESCRRLDADDWIDLQEADYIPRSQPGLYRIEEDRAASNGMTRRMPNTHRIWACHSYPLGDYGVTDGSRWRVSMRVRCDASTDDGAAMTVGIYDDATRRSVVSKAVPVEVIRGKEYRTIDLGVHVLGPLTYAWAAPVVREKDEVEAVYVDRVFLTRERQNRGPTASGKDEQGRRP